MTRLAAHCSVYGAMLLNLVRHKAVALTQKEILVWDHLAAHVSSYLFVKITTSPTCGYTMEPTGPIYTRPMTACRSGNAAFYFKDHIDFVTSGCVMNLTSIHTSLPQSHFVDESAAVYSMRSVTGPADTATSS